MDQWGQLTLVFTYTEEGFVQSGVVLVKVGNNDCGGFMFNHLRAMTFIDTLVLTRVKVQCGKYNVSQPNQK